MDDACDTCGSHLFYLSRRRNSIRSSWLTSAQPDSAAGAAPRRIASCASSSRSRSVHDLASAQALNEQIHEVFDESQVYRIDHYLGKETVQNIMVFRFGNTIFEPVWNRNYVDHVQITVAEASQWASARLL